MSSCFASFRLSKFGYDRSVPPKSMKDQERSKKVLFIGDMVRTGRKGEPTLSTYLFAMQSVDFLIDLTEPWHLLCWLV
jgi:hypothetical protein